MFIPPHLKGILRKTSLKAWNKVYSMGKRHLDGIEKDQKDTSGPRIVGE